MVNKLTEAFVLIFTYIFSHKQDWLGFTMEILWGQKSNQMAKLYMKIPILCKHPLSTAMTTYNAKTPKEVSSAKECLSVNNTSNQELPPPTTSKSTRLTFEDRVHVSSYMLGGSCKSYLKGGQGIVKYISYNFLHFLFPNRVKVYSASLADQFFATNLLNRYTVGLLDLEKESA